MSNVGPPPMPPLNSVPNKNPLVKSFNHALEIQTAVDDELKRLSETSIILLKYFRTISTEIQEGPTCGMVALSMALGLGDTTSGKLTEIAKANAWSHEGEMFSCEWMCQLARKVGAKTTHLSGGLQSHLQAIVDCVREGGSLLVPYDKDKNHSPGKFEGTSAHWAVVTGIVVLKSGNASSQNCDESKSCDQRFIDGDPEQRLYACAYQGLSHHVKLWPFEKIIESNNNLVKEDPKREGQLCLPEGGIASGLKGQAVLIHAK